MMAEWTDERMNDLAAQMAAGFDRTDREIGDLRREVGALRTEVKRDIDGLRTEFRGDMRMLHVEIDGVRAMMFRFCIAVLLLMGGFMAALIGLLATSPS
jgi:phage host-nuclease inhibitor protein Gam